MATTQFLAYGTADATGTIETLDLLYDPSNMISSSTTTIQDFPGKIPNPGKETKSGRVVVKVSNNGELANAATVALDKKNEIDDSAGPKIVLGGSRKRSPKKKTQRRGPKRQKGGKSRRV
jgi:hypothetical protein